MYFIGRSSCLGIKNEKCEKKKNSDNNKVEEQCLQFDGLLRFYLQFSPECRQRTWTCHMMKFKTRWATPLPYADSVDVDQIAQSVQSDLSSTLYDKEIFFS